MITVFFKILITMVLQSVLILEYVSLSNLFSFFKFVSSALSSLHFHVNFAISLSILQKGSWKFVRVVMNLQINLLSISVSTIKSLLIHEHNMNSYLFRFYLKIFNNTLQFQCGSLAGFLNYIYLWISCSSFCYYKWIFLSLLVYKNIMPHYWYFKLLLVAF